MKLTLEKTMQKLIMVLLMSSALAVAHGQETSDTADEV